MKKQCGVLAAVRTDIGKVRTENQDRILCSRAAEFFAVADGMGGVLYGTLTAELAVKTMLVVAKEVRKNYIEHQDANRAAEELRQGLEEVSNKIYERGIAMELSSTVPLLQVSCFWAGRPSGFTWVTAGDIELSAMIRKCVRLQ